MQNFNSKEESYNNAGLRRSLGENKFSQAVLRFLQRPIQVFFVGLQSLDFLSAYFLLLGQAFGHFSSGRNLSA